MDLNQNSDQMEMFGYTAEGAQQEADKFVGEDKKPKTGLRTVSLDDIKEEERDRVRAEYKLNDESFSFRNLYNKIPTNARLLIENVLGKDSDITEKNFTNDELIEMILLAEKQEENFRNVRNRKFKNQPENVTTVSPYFRDPDAKGVTTRVDESYKDSLIRTFTDPQYRVATSLGRFDVEKNPSGLRITDEYDFNKVQRDLPTDLKGILRHIRYSPELAGEYLANLLDTPSREVNINIPKKMFKGGAVMEDQMEMAFMNEGGIADDGMDVDPVSGNEVPPGSLAEEVRDDIPAQLSEGEYVVPADVVRYYGVKFFEDLRDQAKMGLADMEANGRIGGEPVPDGGPVNDQELSPQEMQAIQEMMGMAEGGEVQNPYLQQQQLYSQPRPAPIDEKRNTTLTNINPNPVENQMPMQSMASGGQVQGYQPGGPVTPAQDEMMYAKNTLNPFQYGAGFSFMPSTPGAVTPGTGTSLTPTIAPVTGEPNELVLYGPEGQIRTFILPLSEEDKKIVDELREKGYSETKAVTTTPVTGGGGSSSKPPVETDPNKWMEKFDYDKDMDDLGSQTSDMLSKKPIGGGFGLLMDGNTAAQAAANIIIMKNNGASEAAIAKAQSDYDQFVDKYLRFAPKGLINGDRFAKDIVLNNPGKDIGLFRDSVDLNNKPLFKDDNAFNKFMQKTAPKGVTFDPDAKYKTTDDSGKSVEVGSFKRKGSAAPTKSLRPIGRPDNLAKPVYDEFGKVMGYESGTPKKPSSKPSKPKTQAQKDSDAKSAINDWVSATNATKGKKGIERHKAILRQSRASKEATKKIREASGYNKKNEGGLMKKKGKKK